MAVDVVQEIKLRTDLVELVSQYVPLRKAGRAHKGLCPFHAEKTPSFTVDGERGFFKCYGCGAGGDCFKFLELKEGLSFREAGEVLARRLGLEWVTRGDSAERRSERERLYDVVALADRYFRQSLAQAPDVRKYLTDRGLTPETIEEFGLGYAPPGYTALLEWLRRQKVPPEEAEKADLVLRTEERGWRDRFVDRVIFPIGDIEGRPIAFGGRTLRADGVPKYLNSRETPIFVKGKTLYGLHLAKRAIPTAGFAVAVEGYMDLIALHQAGIANSIASLGTAITETHVGVLGRYSKELVMCYDGDSAGIRAATRNSAMFEAAGCEVRVARLPQGEDPDTYIKAHGVDSFRALLTRAEPLLEYQLTNLRANYDLKQEQQRLPFVREAARVIAQSGSHIARQEYATRLTAVLERLAEEWYPGNPQAALRARMSLGHEIDRLLRSQRPTHGPAVAPAPAAQRPPAASGRHRAERYVVRAALSEYRWGETVQARLRPEHFSDLRLAGLVAHLLSPTAEGAAAEGALAARAAVLQADPAYAEVVSDLLLDEAPLSDEGFLECVESLERARDEQRLAELRRLYDEGALTGEDPRRDELRALLGKLGGRQRRED
jgi:DNA primase